MSGNGFDLFLGKVFWGLFTVVFFIIYASTAIKGKLYFRGGSSISGLPARLIGIVGVGLISLSILNTYLLDPNGMGLNWLFWAYVAFIAFQTVAMVVFMKGPIVVLKIRNVPLALLIGGIGAVIGAGYGVFLSNSLNAFSLLEWIVSICISLCLGIGFVILLGRGPAESAFKQLGAGIFIGTVIGFLSGGVISWLL